MSVRGRAQVSLFAGGHDHARRRLGEEQHVGPEAPRQLEVAGRPPRLDLDAEKRLHSLVLEAASARWLRSAHDCSDGGLAVALAECAFRGEEPGLGGHFELPGRLRPDVLLFSESPSRMIVTTREEAHLRAAAHRHRVPCHRLGTVEGRRLALLSGSRVLVSLPIEELHRAWMSLEVMLESQSVKTDS